MKIFASKYESPLMGSDIGTRQTRELSRRPALLMPTRSAANSPMLPPSAWRVATTISNQASPSRPIPLDHANPRVVLRSRTAS